MTDIALDEKALLPCPHCGEDLVEHTDHHGSWWAHRNEPADCAHGVTQLFDAEDIEQWNRRASPSQVAPANPAQVTDDDQAEKFRKAMLMAERVLGAIPASVSGKRLTAIDPVQVEISRAVSILWGARQDAIHAGWNPTAAIGAGGQAVKGISEEQADFEGWAKSQWTNGQSIPHTAWMGWEARAALSQPHPADERVVEALEAARQELWEMGASEVEYGALWLVRRLIAAKEGR